MVSLLARWLIKDHKQYDTPAVRTAYGMLCGILGIVLNLLLFGGKFLAGTLTGSIAITADAFNNLSDAGSSIITLIGFKLAAQKPDREHPYGHGRIEYLTGLIVSLLILLAGFELLTGSIEKIASPTAATLDPLSLVILIGSILVKLYMFFYNRGIARRIHSDAMKATGTDSLCDCLSTAIVLVATVIGSLTDLPLDGWAGLLVSGFILFSGFQAAKDTVAPLLGQPPEPEFIASVESLVLAHPDVLGIHDLIVHDYGPGRCMVSLHAEVDANGNILALHDSIDNIEKQLAAQLNIEAVIHMDPIITDDEQTGDLRRRLSDILNTLGIPLSFHDFRVVKGPTHTNLIFDLVVPFSIKQTDTQLREQISQAFAQIDPSLFCVIEIDRDYSGILSHKE
jgi:cation diffusion facilitator family transporter